MDSRGCGNNKKLIKAHVIPESFFVGLKSSDRAPLEISQKKGVYPKRRPIGVYDKTILCRECEDKFQEVDNYGQRSLLANEEKHRKVEIDGILTGFIVKDIDYNLLKRFFFSVLWRASISRHNFYSRINLGPHEDKIKRLIWNGEPGVTGEYDCFLAKFVDSNLGKSILDPHMERWDHVNYARIYMYGYVVYLKVDQRPTPKDFQPLILREDQDLYIVSRHLLKSKELPLILDIVNDQRT